MIEQFRLFALAIRLHTRAHPSQALLQHLRAQPQRLSRATRYFPLVGLLIGLLVALVYMLAAFAFPHPIAVLIALICGVLCTGARQELQWAAFCDGASGHEALPWRARLPAAGRRTEPGPGATEDSGAEPANESAATGEQRSIGIAGAIGLVLLFALKIETLAHLDSNWTPIALITVHPFSRACAVLMMALLRRIDTEGGDDPAGDDRLREGMRLRRRDAAFALLTGFAPTVLAAWWFDEIESFTLAALPALIATVWMCLLCWRHWRGYDAASAGATQQAAETMYLLGLLAWATLTVSYVEE